MSATDADGVRDAMCTHEWATCPVHGTRDGSLPPFRRVLTCIYGGTETKAGTPWDESDSDAVVERMARRFDA